MKIQRKPSIGAPLEQDKQDEEDPQDAEKNQLQKAGFFQELFRKSSSISCLPIESNSRNIAASIAETLMRGIVYPKKSPHNASSFRPFLPTGMQTSQYHPWSSSCLQLVMFLPFLRGLFIYAEPSLSPFFEFMQVYEKNQMASLPVPKKAILSVTEALRKTFPNTAFKEATPADVIELLLERLHGFSLNGALFFRKISLQVPAALYTEKADQGAEQGKSRKKIRHVFILPKHVAGFCNQIELDGKIFQLKAFIERREVKDSPPLYLAYLRFSEYWVQCNEQRIFSFKEVNLIRSIKNANLLYYELN